jgi:hypothetical protein
MDSIPYFRLLVKRYELNVRFARILDILINLQPVTQLKKERI